MMCCGNRGNSYGLLVLCLWAGIMQAVAQQRDSVYFQFFAGINKSANEHLPWSEFSSYPWSFGCFVGMGKEWTPLWGGRLSFGYNHNKSRNVPACESKDTWGWDDVELFADATFDLTDVWKGKSSEERNNKFNLKAFAGVGGLATFRYPKDRPLSYLYPYSADNKICWGVHAGLTARWHLSDYWHWGAELSHTMAPDKFNGVVDHRAPMDGRTNLSIGITYLMFRPKRPPKGPVVYSNRLKTIPRLPLKLPEPEPTKKRQIAGRAFLDFPVNETTIYPAYRRNPDELGKIRSSVDSARFDPTIRIVSVSLHGYASPESPYANNTRLAKGRTAALVDYLKGQYDLPDSVFHTAYTPEDWENLRAFVEAGNRRKVKGDWWYDNPALMETPGMPEEVRRYREELLTVIDSSLEPDAKEAQLKQVGGGKPYQWLHRHVYPGLRHTDYIIEYVVREFPLNEAKRLIYLHPEALSVEEMYRVAQSYEVGSDGYYEALTIAADRYPDDPTANLNAACACVQVRRLKDAEAYLERAGDSKEADYVRRVIRAMQGKGSWRMEHGKVVDN